MFQKKYYLLICLMILYCICHAQRDHRSRFDLSLGYGAAGSFFVRSYDEKVIYPDDVKIYRKDFIGSNMSLDAGMHLKNGYALRLGFNRQQFSRKITYNGNFDLWKFELDRKIYHIDNFFSLFIDKRWTMQYKNGERLRHSLLAGSGIYYLRSNQHEIDIQYSRREYIDVGRNYRNSKLEEAGIFITMGYEYLYQPKVSIGINGRFNYTVSTGEPESISLTPYIKILF